MKQIQDEAYSRLKSFGYAFEGWWHVLKTQHNAWIHAVASVVVVLMGFWFSISLIEWGLIIVAIMVVWMSEFMNTAIEAVVDMTSPDFHPLAKVAKDVAAAAVLIAAGGAILIALVVFGPKLLNAVGVLGN
ncbi:MAG: diacylglycerol kinase family protein [Ardenticatenaceae bacterium]|nr:diacylglycerol kinase family protein [Ardenticatenaceae bacterium]